MADEAKEQEAAGTDAKVQPDGRMTFATAWNGVVGLGKAALRVDRAAEPVIRQRRAICAACPQATGGLSAASRCSACTCFIFPKTANAGEKCPMGKW